MGIDEPPLLYRSNRFPLAEKQLNTMSPRRSLVMATLADSQATFLVHGNVARESKLAPPHCPLALDAMHQGYSFHPLPPLSSASSLQLPIFLEQPFIKSPLKALGPTSPLTKPLPTIPLPNESTLRPSPNDCHIGIPALSHPNSPYVPWSSVERGNFIRPPTSASQISGFSSCLSCSYSRSGAQAHEPGDNIHPPLPARNIRLAKVTKKLKAIRRLVRNVATRLSFPNRSSDKNIYNPPTTAAPTLAPERHVHVGRFLSPSRTSVDSGSMHAWLVERKRLASEDDMDTSGRMTLEEYDRAGSWIDARPCSETSCSTQTSELHAFPLMMARTYSIDPQVSLLWFPDDPDSSTPISGSVMDPSSPFRSSPSPRVLICDVESKARSFPCILRPSPSRDSSFSSKIYRARTLSTPNNSV